MGAWGFLGNPTKEQIENWKNMPYGQFKQMVDSLKKKAKGRSFQKHAVEVKKTTPYVNSAFVHVEAFDADHAIAQVREMNTSELEWSETKKEPIRISYNASVIR